jgi:hypothetical protein
VSYREASDTFVPNSLTIWSASVLIYAVFGTGTSREKSPPETERDKSANASARESILGWVGWGGSHGTKESK